MSALTRWVLVHKRIVVVSWIVLTIAGIMASGPATDALEPGVLGPRQGGLGDQRRDRQALPRHGRGHRAADAGGHAAAGQDGRLARGPGGPRAESTGASRSGCRSPRIASYASTGDRAFVSEDGRTTFAVVYPQPDPDSVFGENPRAEKAASAALRGRDRRRRAGPPDRLRRAGRGLGRRQRGPGRADRGADRRLRRAARARLRVRLVPGRRPDPDGDRLDHDHVPAAARPDRADRASRRSCSS